jgi:hypothetical protein
MVFRLWFVWRLAHYPNKEIFSNESVNNSTIHYNGGKTPRILIPDTSGVPRGGGSGGLTPYPEISKF